MFALTGPADAHRLARAALVIADRYRDQELRLAGVAGALGVSKRTLQRAYSRSAQEPFAEQLRRVRLAAAALLLAEQSIAVGDVAALVGYRSVSAFTRAFAARYHLAPAAFRAAARAAGRRGDR